MFTLYVPGTVPGAEYTAITRVPPLGRRGWGHGAGLLGELRRGEFSFQCWEADSEETHKVRLREIP